MSSSAEYGSQTERCLPEVPCVMANLGDRALPCSEVAPVSDYLSAYAPRLAGHREPSTPTAIESGSPSYGSRVGWTAAVDSVTEHGVGKRVHSKPQTSSTWTNSVGA